MRPQVSDDNVERMQDAINDKVRIPADRLTFNEQLELLVELFEEERDKATQPQEGVIQETVNHQSSNTIRR